MKQFETSVWFSAVDNELASGTCIHCMHNCNFVNTKCMIEQD
jgi:hypothetical protein